MRRRRWLVVELLCCGLLIANVFLGIIWRHIDLEYAAGIGSVLRGAAWVIISSYETLNGKDAEM